MLGLQYYILASNEKVSWSFHAGSSFLSSHHSNLDTYIISLSSLLTLIPQSADWRRRRARSSSPSPRCRRTVPRSPLGATSSRRSPLVPGTTTCSVLPLLTLIRWDGASVFLMTWHICGQPQWHSFIDLLHQAICQRRCARQPGK